MAVAVQNKTETVPPNPDARLAVASLVGVIYLVASLAFLLHGLPALWMEAVGVDSFIAGAFLVMVMVGAAVGLVYLGRMLAGSQPPEGLRAAIFLGFFWLFICFQVTRWIGLWADRNLMVGVDYGVTAAVGLTLFYYYFKSYFKPGRARRMAHIEDMGWFRRTTYKPNQGQRVRRGTIVGLLIVAACGIWTMFRRGVLHGDWAPPLPFTDEKVVVPLLPQVMYTVPILLIGLVLWFSWRIVNYPPFADFLIATEAEINKVSWTTRKRLVQDTIVVLVTVLLMTFFLLIVDILWQKVLTSRFVYVLQVSSEQQKAAATEKNYKDW